MLVTYDLHLSFIICALYLLPVMFSPLCVLYEFLKRCSCDLMSILYFVLSPLSLCALQLHIKF